MSNPDARFPNVSRRDFARAAALAATAACVPRELFGGSPTTAAALDEQATSPTSVESNPEVEEKVQAILRKYGARLSAEQKADIRRLTIEGQKPLEAMRKFPLENADQPANVMKIYPDAEQAEGAAAP